MTVYLVISLPEIPYIHRICMVLANPKNVPCCDPTHAGNVHTSTFSPLFFITGVTAVTIATRKPPRLDAHISDLFISESQKTESEACP